MADTYHHGNLKKALISAGLEILIKVILAAVHSHNSLGKYIII
jgi:hypothetical protein